MVPIQNHKHDAGDQEAATLLLARLNEGDALAADELLPVVYEQLRAMAASSPMVNTILKTLRFVPVIGFISIPFRRRSSSYQPLTAAILSSVSAHFSGPTRSVSG